MEIAHAVVFLGLAAGPRDHRPVPGRQLRRVPPSRPADPTRPAGSVGGVADLHASASKVTGLTDFGPDDYTDGLTVLLESCARDASLTRWAPR